MNDLVLALRDLIRKIVTEDIALIVSVAVIIAAFFLVWLLLRGIRLWYWKVNDSAGMLYKIDRRLKNVEKYIMKESRKRMPGQAAKASQTAEILSQEPKAAPIAASTAEPPSAAEEDGAARPPEPPVAEVEALNAIGDDSVPELKRMETYLGKSGKVYGREELEAQIKD